MQQFERVAKRSLAQLNIWSKEKLGDRKRKQNELIEKLKTAKQRQTQAIDEEEIRKLENQISNMLIDKEVYWKQSSRADWLREGEKIQSIFTLKYPLGEERTKSGELKIIEGIGLMIQKVLKGNSVSIFNNSSRHPAQVRIIYQKLSKGCGQKSPKR